MAKRVTRDTKAHKHYPQIIKSRAKLIHEVQLFKRHFPKRKGKK